MTFVVGMVSGSLGPLLPQLAVRLSAPVEALGSMFSALFVGALVTQFVGGWLNERLGLRNMVLVGTSLLTLGVLGITVSPALPLLLASACLLGLGQGALDISTNVLVAAVHSKEKAVSAVNLLHFAFGAGAVLAPIVASAALRRWNTPMPALYLAAAIGLGTLLLGGRLLLDPDAAPPAGSGRAATGLYRAPSLWLLAVLMFLYVGGEMGVGGWTAVYLDRTSTLSASWAALAVSAYWLALTAGRLIGAALGTRIRSSALLLYGVLGCCLGAVPLLLGGGGVALTVIGTLVIGVSYGPIFPTSVVMATELFPFAPSRAVSVVVSLSSLGGMVLPPLQGVLLTRVSPLASVGLVAAGAAGMLALLLLVRSGAGLPAGVAQGEPRP
ncbi:MAG TPA: MFS transporter [Anaeromyxobacter sp.]|nr:MFS transporter [Anaeromyxobacter sp.]